VEVFQSGDGDKFYWSEIGRQKDMKRAERILLGVNASKTPTTEEDAVTPHNHYSLDIDAKSGHITALTSKQNGEHCKYVIQLNTKDGYLVIQDDLGNHISMNSKTSTHMLQTKEGAYVSIVKKDVKMKGGEFRAEFDKIILDGETEITKKATTNEINNTGKISTTISVDTPNINNTDIGSYLNN
jgi:predicted extracellular nuclease